MSPKSKHYRRSVLAGIGLCSSRSQKFTHSFQSTCLPNVLSPTQQWRLYVWPRRELKHGVNALPTAEQDGKGRISIILWGKAHNGMEEEVSPSLLGSDGQGPHANHRNDRYNHKYHPKRNQTFQIRITTTVVEEEVKTIVVEEERTMIVEEDERTIIIRIVAEETTTVAAMEIVTVGTTAIMETTVVDATITTIMETTEVGKTATTAIMVERIKIAVDMDGVVAAERPCSAWKCGLEIFIGSREEIETWKPRSGRRGLIENAK